MDGETGANAPRYRVLLVSSSGGVLLDMLALEPWWSRYDAVWAAVAAADTTSALARQRVYWISEVTLRSPFSLVPSLRQAWRILKREQPDLVVSAGSGPAISFFAVAQARGIPTFWFSTLNLVATTSLTGRICGRLAS